MPSNVGKVFESDFVKSAPNYLAIIRLPDPPQSFTKRSDTRFSRKNPFDYVCFSAKHRILLCAELKTTKFRSISFEDINDDNAQNRLIHKHQILGLMKYDEFESAACGFLFNFRDEKNNEERTYWQFIDDFNKMTKSINKHSVNELDILTNNGIKVQGRLKRVHYSWDIDKLLDDIYDRMYNN